MRAIGITLLLLAATPAVAQRDGREQLHVDIPEGMHEVHRDGNQVLQIIEHIPSGQTVDRWTDMVTVLIFAPQAVASLDDRLQKLPAALTDRCAVAPKIFEPVRFEDGGLPAAVLSVVCGKSKRFGLAEVFISKIIHGAQSHYEVQRAWRFPAATSSDDVPLTQEMVESAKALMKTVYVCDGPAARPC
jgi:hypothetical protein